MIISDSFLPIRIRCLIAFDYDRNMVLKGTWYMVYIYTYGTHLSLWHVFLNIMWSRKAPISWSMSGSASKQKYRIPVGVQCTCILHQPALVVSNGYKISRRSSGNRRVTIYHLWKFQTTHSTQLRFFGNAKPRSQTVLFSSESPPPSFRRKRQFDYHFYDSQKGKALD